MSLTPELGSGVWFIAGAQVSVLRPKYCFRDKLGDPVCRWRGSSGVWCIAGVQVSVPPPEDCFRDKVGDSVRRWRGMAIIGLGPFMSLTPEPGSGVWFIAGAQVSVLQPEHCFRWRLLPASRPARNERCGQTDP